MPQRRRRCRSSRRHAFILVLGVLFVGTILNFRKALTLESHDAEKILNRIHAHQQLNRTTPNHRPIAQGSILPCNEFLKEPNRSSLHEDSWSWHLYSSPSTSRPKALVAQYAGLTDLYPKMLHTTAHVNHAYARNLRYDFVTFVGVLEGCLDWHAAFNKVGILLEAARRNYETCLLLDADALVVNVSMPLEQIQTSKSSLLTAQWVGSHRWNINNGVMIWNLRHEYSDKLLRDWHTRVMERLVKSARGEMKTASDQRALHQALQSTLSVKQQEAWIQNVSNYFYYREGTFVKHFTREKLDSSVKNDFLVGWDAHNTTHERLQELVEAANQVCESSKLCDGL